ncbi:MAG TPA: hypothetical protein VEA35_04785 [Ramlibacter sp.]|nr:hypothetical protein [Ramlibacter sp.]
MRQPSPHPLRAGLLALLASLAGGPLLAGELPLRAPAPTVGAVANPAPGVEIKVHPEGAAAGRAAPARIEGSVDAGSARLRSSFRLDPTGARPMERLETRLEGPAPGPLKMLVIGDTQAGGGGWSRRVNLGGLRFGRALAAAPDAPLAGGASDYEVAWGRLRPDPGADYGEVYSAAAYRAGLGGGLSAEARGEWTGARAAHGLELVQRVGPSTLQAVLARSDTAQQAGHKWGLQYLQAAGNASWKLKFDRAERDYSPLAGPPEARTALVAGAQLPLDRRTTAELAYSRALAVDATAADASLKLSARRLLAHKAQLGVGLSLQEGPQARWGASVSLSLPLEQQAP